MATSRRPECMYERAHGRPRHSAATSIKRAERRSWIDCNSVHCIKWPVCELGQPPACVRPCRAPRRRRWRTTRAGRAGLASWETLELTASSLLASPLVAEVEVVVAVVVVARHSAGSRLANRRENLLLEARNGTLTFGQDRLGQSGLGRWRRNSSERQHAEPHSRACANLSTNPTARQPGW